MTVSLIVIFIISFFAFSISAICGGGAGLMLIPVLGRFLPVSQVPAALSIGTFTSSASRIIFFKKTICWNIVKYFVPAALPAVWIGAYLLKFINPIYLEFIMGIFLISNLIFLFQKPQKVEKIKKSNLTLIIIGFFAGFLSGLTGAVGVLFNRFYLQHGLKKEEIIATRAANEIILHLVKIILYFLFGLISIKVIYISIVVALSTIFSAWIMKRILPKISEVIFKKIGYATMGFSGFIMLSQSITSLLTINKGYIDTDKTFKGFETKLKWQNANYALEFTYNEGFEFEQVIPINELTEQQQALIESKKQNANKIIIESVYSIGEKSYEVYYFNNNKLINKFDFK